MAGAKYGLVRERKYLTDDTSLQIICVTSRVLIIPDTALEYRISDKSHMIRLRIKHHGICRMSRHIYDLESNIRIRITLSIML